MTKTSKRRYVSTESCRLMRGADMPFSEYTCEHCTEILPHGTVGCNGFDRYIGRLSQKKVYKALRAIAG